MEHPQNMPTLYRNALDALPNDFARDVWLWAIERDGMDRMGYAADRFTHEVLAITGRISPMLDAAATLHGESRHDPSLVDFILKRHANSAFGGNVSPGYCANA